MPRAKRKLEPVSPTASTAVDAPAPKAPPAPRKKRQLSTYNEFIRDHYHEPKIQALPVRMRIRELARRWQEHKKSIATGK